MKLVIGGTAQGKLEYVLLKYNLQKNVVWEGVDFAAALKDRDILGRPEGVENDVSRKEELVIINHFHQWVKSRMINGGCPEEEILSFLDSNGDCIIICDEIGNGIVPADPFEREYRERVGRILVELARRAEEVERIVCGIGQKIK